MQFYFIRHAQSENNALWDQTGSNKGRSEDPELTNIGRQQARILAEFLRWGNHEGGLGCDRQSGQGFAITHLYSSMMVRAVATGTMVAQALDLPLRAWLEIHERGGIYIQDELSGAAVGLPGKGRAYFTQHYPHFVLPEEVKGDLGWWNKSPMESPEQYVVRARKFLDDLLARHGKTQDRVAVISHGGFYNDFLTALLDLPVPNGHWFTMKNTAITRIDFHEDLVELVYQNRADFLPPDLVT